MSLKPKSRQTLDIIASNPKIDANKAYMQTHPTTNPRAAAVAAHRLLSKPEAQIYLDKHVNKAKAKIVELIDSDKQEIALKASESILDRNLGKPLTRTNNTNLSLTLEDLLGNLT